MGRCWRRHLTRQSRPTNHIMLAQRLSSSDALEVFRAWHIGVDGLPRRIGRSLLRGAVDEPSEQEAVCYVAQATFAWPAPVCLWWRATPCYVQGERLLCRVHRI